MRRLGIVVVGLGLVLVLASLLLIGCATGAGERTQPTETVVLPTAELPTPTSNPSNAESWEKAIPVDKSQTLDGVRLTVDEVGIAIPSKLSNADQLTYLNENHPGAKALLAVDFSVVNSTGETVSLPVYTSTTALVNDERIDMDYSFSKVDTTILSGANQQMSAIFVVSRYMPDEIHTVRFVLQKTISFTLPESETTYDFTVQVP